MAHSFTGNPKALSYIALKQLKVGAGYRMPGDLVPEAASWRNVHNYLSSGYLAVVGTAHANPGQANRVVGVKEGPNALQKRPRPFDQNGVASNLPADVSN